MLRNVLIFLVCHLALFASAQVTRLGEVVDYSLPSNYTVAGVTVTGVEFSDVQAIKLFAGIQVGQEITVPGDDITQAIRNLWRQQLFSDISIYAAEVRGTEIFLVIDLKEMPRLGRYNFPGLKRSERESLRELLDLYSGRIVNENLIATTKKKIIDHYIDKGFLNADVTVTTEPYDEIENSVKMAIKVDKGQRVKISEINFVGVEEMSEKKLARSMKETKQKAWWRVFKSSKYIEESYEGDKEALIAKYNAKGFRNARIVSDSIYRTADNRIAIDITVDEGTQFYFRNIYFSGNTKYRSSQLDSILKIKSGDVYDAQMLETRLYMNPKGLDITSLYQDDGYLQFQAFPVEVLVENDSIDIEVRMYEGKQFRIGRVTVVGNSKTNDHVIYREIKTKPGALFSRTDIIRTQRELARLNYFNPEAFQVNPIQNDDEGTVDIEYVVEEKPSDQIELSGGWGGGRVVGTLGLSFTNFSLRRMFKKDAWRPIPSGDGQQLSIRAQSNGVFFQSYNLSFTEPWLGGKKPNSLTFGVYHSIQSNGQRRTIDGEANPLRQSLNITGASIGFGQRWKRPDDWFLMYAGVSYQHFDLNNFQSFFSFSNGKSNNLALNFSIQRNSVADPIFPTWGSNVKFSFKATAPYSFIRKNILGEDVDYASMTDEEKFKWVEYHKWKFTANWYTPLTKGSEENNRKLVLNANFGMGVLGLYNSDIGLSPFERFYLGGVFLSGFVLDGREIVNLRGYDDLSVTYPNPNTGSPSIVKYGVELRYPLSTNPNATIYALSFLEAGNTWANVRDFNPFNVKRAGGVGLRIFLPMFGLLGLDYGWRLDDIPEVPNMTQGQFHFSIGMNLGEL
ncbi:MAG: outer membrane protein assembly factor BamA [Flavobacteriales bacterium]|nr:outer membrane protein assembly factor BamA [Flavobacteriales bacterium]